MSEDVTLSDFAEEDTKPEQQNEDSKPTSWGSVPADWNERRICDVTELVSDGSHNPPKRVSDGIQILSSQNIQNGRIDFDKSPSYISPSDFEQMDNNHSIQQGDLLMTIVGSIGRSAIVGERSGFALQRSVALLRTNRQLSSQFLKFVTDSHRFHKQADSRSRATAQGGLYLEALNKINLPVPPLSEQRKIATILYTVDRAIEKTEEIIATRERIKRGLMQDIFRYGVDSNGQLRSTEDQSYRETKYGSAPVDWEILPLEDIVADDASITYGIVKPGNHCPEGVPVVKVENIIDGEVQTDNLLHTDSEIHQKYNRAELKQGDLLFTIRGTVGRMAFVPESLEGGNITQDTARIRVREANPEFVRYYLETGTPHNYFKRHTKGQAVQGINLEDLQQVPVHLPSRKEQERIVEILDSHTKQIQNERKYRDQLQRLKRGLTQDLLSGTVRTTDTNIEVPDEIAQYG